MPYDRIAVHGSFVLVLRNQDIDVLDSATLRHVFRLEQGARGLDFGEIRVCFLLCYTPFAFTISCL